MRRSVLWAYFFLPFLCTAILAFEYTPMDVQTAFDRHDVRRLVTYANDGDKAVRLASVQALVTLNDPQAIPHLIGKLDDPEADVVLAALWGLPNFGAQASGPTVIARLEEAQHAQSIDVRKAAGVVLEDLKDPEQLEQMRRALMMRDHEQHPDAVKFYITRKDYSILPAARQMLKNSDPFLKQTGVVLLHGLDDRDQLEAIAALLKDPSPTLRASAALVIGEWEEAAALRRLEPLLKDREPLVRASAVSALAKHQTPHISGLIAQLAKDPEDTVRYAAARALPAFATPAGTQALLSLLHDKNAKVRLQAVEGLLALSASGADAASHVVYLLDDPDLKIRLTLLEHMDTLLKIPRVNKKVVKQKLLKLTQDKDPKVRALANKYAGLVR
jgi:HEAT repeat protein